MFMSKSIFIKSSVRSSCHFCFWATFLPFLQLHPVYQLSQLAFLCLTLIQAVYFQDKPLSLPAWCTFLDPSKPSAKGWFYKRNPQVPINISVLPLSASMTFW